MNLMTTGISTTPSADASGPGQPNVEPPKRRNTTLKGDVRRLVTGTAIAHLISILAAPILTRLYTAEMFGMAALFTALTSILGVAACMRYELSIVLPDNDREAANLLGVALCFSVATSFLTIPIVLFGGPHVLRWVKMPELSPYLWLIPIAVWFSGLFFRAELLEHTNKAFYTPVCCAHYEYDVDHLRHTWCRNCWACYRRGNDFS